MRVGPGGAWREERERLEREYEEQYGDSVLYGKMARAKSGEAILNDTLIEAFQHLLLEGNTRSNAARVLGIQRATIAKWLVRGKTDIEAGDMTAYAKFTWMVDRCEGGQERKLVQAAMKVATAPTSDGTLALKILERRNPDAWAPAIPEASDPANVLAGANRQVLLEEAKRVLQKATQESNEIQGEVLKSNSG